MSEAGETSTRQLYLSPTENPQVDRFSINTTTPSTEQTPETLTQHLRFQYKVVYHKSPRNPPPRAVSDPLWLNSPPVIIPPVEEPDALLQTTVVLDVYLNGNIKETKDLFQESRVLPREAVQIVSVVRLPEAQAQQSAGLVLLGSAVEQSIVFLDPEESESDFGCRHTAATNADDVATENSRSQVSMTSSIRHNDLRQALVQVRTLNPAGVRTQVQPPLQHESFIGFDPPRDQGAFDYNVNLKIDLNLVLQLGGETKFTLKLYQQLQVMNLRTSAADYTKQQFLISIDEQGVRTVSLTRLPTAGDPPFATIASSQNAKHKAKTQAAINQLLRSRSGGESQASLFGTKRKLLRMVAAKSGGSRGLYVARHALADSRFISDGILFDSPALAGFDHRKIFVIAPPGEDNLPLAQ